MEQESPITSAGGGEQPTDGDTSSRRTITEKEGLHEQWYQRAEEMTLAKLPEFLRELTEDYVHDYGTICHAIAAAAVAAAWAVERSPVGGITGFQAGAIMWEFLTHWQTEYRDKPLRLLDYGNLLYPQYRDRFTGISPATWTWVQQQAAEELAAEEMRQPHQAANSVVDHWRSIVAGNVPFGLRVVED